MVRVRRIAPDPAQDLDPADLGQLEVQQDQVGHVQHVPAGELALAEEIVQGLGTVADDLDPVDQLGLLERVQSQLDVVGVVLDEQDRPRSNGQASVLLLPRVK